MTERRSKTKSTRRTGTSRHKTPAASKKKARAKDAASTPESRSVLGLVSDLAGNVMRIAAQTGGVSLQMGRAALAKSAKQRKMMEETGHYLRDLREIAGLTVSELAVAVDLEDKSVLKAVENGTATLSFELILRLAALLARHDPIPFIVRATRTYNPRLWKILDDWGIGRLPLHFEREREFINIYRGRDDARGLSDEQFQKVLGFTGHAFDMALDFAAAEGHVAKSRVAVKKKARARTVARKR